uniref:Stage II sporulation protein M n=1 Tax=Methanococcus maripaludis (strain C6 / ATCC BAA-1332) TaxID=444158 RepID=A9A9I7_METM6
MSFEFLKKQFNRFLNLNFTNKYIITYFLSWTGLFTTLFVSKLLKPLINVESAGVLTTAKYEVISTAVSSQIGINYYSIWYSYFISNSLACITIFLVFVMLPYIYTRDISKGKSTINDYFNVLLFFYLLILLNPLTGVLGASLSLSEMLAIIPHGLFEYAGFSMAIVLGIEYSIYKLPLEYKKEVWDTKQKLKFLLKFFSILIFIFIAGGMETLDWIIFNYAKENDLSILHTFFEVYYDILKSLLF